MADEIKQKIVLEGEKEYSAALKEANRNLKTLRSDLKAETAELGANANAQQKNEVKARSLQRQIAEQEKIVSTLKAALAEVKEKYGDNSEEVAKWEQKVNNARYSLATMNNDLERTQQALKSNDSALHGSADAYDDAADAAVGYADAADAAAQIADQITFQNVIQAADSLKGKLVDAIGFIKDVGKAAWDWMTESGEWADELSTLSDKTQIDKQTLQGWRYAANFVDTEVETITGAYVKLRDRTDGANEALASLGITAGQNVDPGAVFWEVIDAVNAMDEATRKTKGEDALKTLFGKGYQDMLPLIKAGREGWESYIREAQEKGLIMSDEQIDKLSEFDDARIRMEESFNALKLQIAEKLAPAFETIANSLGDMVDKFIEWAGTEEGQKALTDLGTAIENIVTSLTGDIDFNKIVSDAQKAIEGLTGALGWISDNWTIVRDGILGIGAVLGALQVSSTFMTALQLIKGINWRGIPAGGATPTTTPAAAGAAGAAPVVAPAAAGSSGGGGFFAGIGSKFGMAGGASMAGLLAWLAAGGYTGYKMIEANLKDEKLNQIYGQSGEGGLLSAMSADSYAKAAKYFSLYSDSSKTGTEEAFQAREELFASLEQDGIELAEQGVSLLEQGFDNYLNESDPDGMVERILNEHPDMLEGAMDAAAEAIEEAAATEEPGGLKLTEAQRQAAETYWDAWRKQVVEGGPENDAAFDEAFDALEAAFAGQEDTLEQLYALMEGQNDSTLDNGWADLEDLPETWFNTHDQLTSTDIQGFRNLPAEMQTAVMKGAASGVSGLQVTLDGRAVGVLVAPYVSEQLALEM